MTTASIPTDQGFFVEPWDDNPIPDLFDDQGHFNIDAFMNYQPVDRPLLPFIQPDPPQLTRHHFKCPSWQYSRAEWLIGENFWAGTTVTFPVWGRTRLCGYDVDGDYVTLKGDYGSRYRVHRFAWVETNG
ncbi:hypothetical protein ACFRCI_17360 [Streptomyces sp. NPDC056638]|uniref:hypothetical protein n=1 Tax=Streptomyces sp. NPDC056638 TaxID=3345887 RepID=UPI0036821F63